MKTKKVYVIHDGDGECVGVVDNFSDLKNLCYKVSGMDEEYLPIFPQPKDTNEIEEEAQNKKFDDMLKSTFENLKFYEELRRFGYDYELYSITEFFLNY